MMSRCSNTTVLLHGLALLQGLAALAMAVEPLPISASYWKDPAFLKAFNGSYRIEARIEPSITSEERALLVELQQLMADEKREQAIKLLAESSLTKNSAALTFNLANLQLEEGQLDKAVASFEAAIKAYPSFRRAHRNLGLARVRKEDWDKALEHLGEAVRLGDSEGLTYGLLGYCRLSRGEFASAMQAYRLAQLTEPNVTEWSAGIAQCMQQLDQREEAAALLDEVIRKRPLEASYAVLKANIHLQLEQQDQAAKALEMAHRLGTLGADPILLLAELHLGGGRVEESVKVMESAFERQEKPGENAMLRLFQIAVVQQQWLLAKGLLDRVPAKQQSRALRLAKARYLIESKQDPEAGIQLLKTLTTEDPTDGEALLVYARLLAASGQQAAAELLIERAAADAEWTFEAYRALTNLRAKQGRYEAALESLDKALQIQSDADLEAYRNALRRTLEASR
ncbi:MAG: tetratricopeptide repeat protein [Luteolibacter sp.]